MPRLLPSYRTDHHAEISDTCKIGRGTSAASSKKNQVTTLALPCFDHVAFLNYVLAKKEDPIDGVQRVMAYTKKKLSTLISLEDKSEVKPIINPWRACAAKVTVLGLCVCVSVCLSPRFLPPRATMRPTRYTSGFSGT